MLNNVSLLIPVAKMYAIGKFFHTFHVFGETSSPYFGTLATIVNPRVHLNSPPPQLTSRSHVIFKFSSSKLRERRTQSSEIFDRNNYSGRIISWPVFTAKTTCRRQQNTSPRYRSKNFYNFLIFPVKTENQSGLRTVIIFFSGSGYKGSWIESRDPVPCGSGSRTRSQVPVLTP